MTGLNRDRICDLCKEIITFRNVPYHMCNRAHHLNCIEEGFHRTFVWGWHFSNSLQRFTPTLLYLYRACTANRH